MVASATEEQCASKISKTVPTTGFLWRHCRSEKAFVCAGMWATTQKVKFSLRAAYAELTRNLAIVGGNYNQKNRTIKKTHKETIVEGTTGRFQLMKWFHQYYKYFAASVEYPLSNVISYANSPTSQNPHVKPNQNLNTSLTLICTCHTCAYAQCLRSTFLTKPLTPPCANQGFAYAKCSYDKALIKTIQNGFWGRSFDNYETL